MIFLFLSALLLGGLTGLLLEKASVRLINRRVSGQVQYRFSGSLRNTIAWCAVNAAGWAFALAVGGLNLKTMEFILLYSACIVLSAVDLNIKKIPNEIILFILITGFAFTLAGFQSEEFSQNMTGLAVGLAMFLLPSLIGKGAGMGDVKFAAAAGFCLGLYDFLTAVIFMTVVLLIYTAALFMRGKGSLKTKVALGPFMASGFVFVMLLNIVNMKQMLFDMETMLVHK